MSLVGYNAFLTGFLVFFKRRDKIGFHYLIFSLFVACWGVGISFMMNNNITAPVAQGWGLFSQICALFIPATWLHFVLVYTEQFDRKKKILSLSYLLTLLIFPFTLSKKFVAGFRPMVQIKNYPIPGPFYVGFTVLFFVIVSYSFWIIYCGWRKTQSLEKKKDYALLFFAQLYGFFTGSLSFLGVYGIAFQQYNLLAMPLWQFLLTYAMVRYSLFDLEEMARAAQKDKLAAIGTLAASINHEIRNPLFIIKGFAESHLENLKAGVYRSKEEILEKSQEIHQKTIEHAQLAMEIMKRLAIFAKESAKQEIRFEEVDLKKTFENVLPLVQHELELDKIQLEEKIPEDLKPIRADRGHIEEIFFNLVVNACQAMKNGGTIDIGAEQQNGHVKVFIKDNGPGIPSEDLSKIFEPFYTTKESGTGLGLYITKKLVERSGGRISVESRPSGGTRFVLQFPVEKNL